MKRIAVFTGLALALAAPAFAQDSGYSSSTPPAPKPTTPTPVTPETPKTPETPITTQTPVATPTPMTPEIPVTPEPDPATATTTTTTATDDTKSAGAVSSSGHSENVYHGPHRYPKTTKGRAGDPPVIDHSADTLIVEPPISTITIPIQP
jgi:hypothetical protein